MRAISAPSAAFLTVQVTFWGTPCEFTRAAFEALLACGIRPTALLLWDPVAAAGRPCAPLPPPPPAPPGDLAFANPYAERSALHAAWAHSVPAYALSRLAAPETAALLAAAGADVACVACFPRRIPSPLLALPRLGFLNLHPSLLPRYRGPAPLFWQLRHGETETGVTVHWMDEELDTGDIARQTALALPDGATGPELDRLLGAAGGRLLASVCTGVSAPAGAAAPLRTPQPGSGSYHPWPRPDDFALDPRWSAQRAFNFMRGVSEWRMPFTIALGAKTFRLSAAQSCDPAATLSDPWRQIGSELLIRFSPGVLRATLWAGDA